MRVYPEGGIRDGKYCPGPHIWVEGKHKANRLTLEEAKELRNHLTALIEVVEEAQGVGVPS